MRVWLWIIVGCLIGLHPYAAQGQDNNMQTQINELLRSIVPIKTTAEDVKKLLGEPIRTSPDFHEFDDFNVLVSYTNGLPCSQTRNLSIATVMCRMTLLILLTRQD